MSWLSTLLKRRKRKAELKTVSQQTRTSGTPVSDSSSMDTSIFTDPLNPLNPLNPLSPISPISIWNTSETESSPMQTYPDDSIFESSPSDSNDYSSSSHDYDSGSSSFDSGSSFDSSSSFDSTSSSW